MALVTPTARSSLGYAWRAWKQFIGQDEILRGFASERARGQYTELVQNDREGFDSYEMADHEQQVAGFHATEVEPRLKIHHDMAGGNIEDQSPPMGKYNSLSNSSSTLDGDEPTDEEKRTLRKVPDKLPWAAFLVAVVELCERSAYYGLSGPFQNYIENRYHDSNGLPGAIGLGQTAATGLTNFFQFWCYLTPILGAIVADQYLGKYLTIVYFSVIYIIGLIILFVTSLPFAIERGAALGGLITAMVVIGLGTGGIKSNVSPLIAEQYTETKSIIKVLKSGERVIVDPGVTIQRIYMIFYMAINIGSLSPIATTNLEKYVGFWSAYLIPLCLFVVGFFVLIAGKKTYVVRPPKGSIILDSFRAIWIGIKNKGNLDAAKPSVSNVPYPWNDQFIAELKRAIVGCKVFLFYPFYWVCYFQMMNNFVSQAGQMELHGIPNDIMQNIDPITIIIFIPILDRLVYPTLRKFGIDFKPITRIFFGFILGSLSMAYAAIVQHLIYSRGPCYDMPLNCPAAELPDGTTSPNHIHVAVQTPAYFFLALSEIFAAITGYEYAFTKAPASMKSFVMSLFLLTNAFGAALAAALSPVSVDPKLTWMYVGLAVTCAISGCVFWGLYRGYNKREEELNDLNKTADLDGVAKPIRGRGGGEEGRSV